MKDIEPFDWHRIFLGNEQDYMFMLEIGFRVVFIYLFAVVALRFMGKRGNRSLSTYENVLIIALGSATGDVMFYPQVPLVYACIVIVIIVTLTRLLQNLQLLFKPVNTFLDGQPILLVRHGVIDENNLARCRVRKEELHGLLRAKGVRDINEVEFSFFERSGEVSVFKKEISMERNGSLIDKLVS